MRQPKNISKYESSLLAGMKLLQLAIEHVFSCKSGVMVHWHLTVSYWHDDWSDSRKMSETGAKVIPSQGRWSNL